MAKIGKISSLKKEYNSSQLQTMQSELAKKGMSRVPGTGVFKYPYKELDGRYRTGLDPNAAYIKRIQDPSERELEVERVTRLKAELEDILNIPLDPRAEFWNYSKSSSSDDQLHVQPVKLMDGDNLFDLSVPIQLLNYSWLRVHPTIASSYQAWERGEYPADTQFYVVDEDIESQVANKKKKSINKAITTLEQLTPTNMKKVARQLGLPVTDDTKEETAYNLIDTLLKQTEFKTGVHQGLNPVEVFMRYATMKQQLLDIKDLVNQAITFSIYRKKVNGRIYEGEVEIAIDEDTLVKYLMDEDHQEDLIMLEDKIKKKKIALV